MEESGQLAKLKEEEVQSSMSTENREASVSAQRRRELADFLRTRREKLKPEQVGLAQGSRRRTPGLRREEVAELANVGTTWYTWLEQARDIQPSAEVLRRIGKALRLNQAEMRHLFALAGKAPPPDLTAPPEEVVTESMRRFLEESLQVPAILVGARWDILEMNSRARDIPVFKELLAGESPKRNWVYFVFCSSAAHQTLDAWETHARRLLAEFRASLSDQLDNPWVLELIDLLKAESKEFATWWKEHDVRDNSPVMFQAKDPNGQMATWERFIVKLGDHLPYRVLTFTPIKK